MFSVTESFLLLAPPAGPLVCSCEDVNPEVVNDGTRTSVVGGAGPFSSHVAFSGFGLANPRELRVAFEAVPTGLIVNSPGIFYISLCRTLSQTL